MSLHLRHHLAHSALIAAGFILSQGAAQAATKYWDGGTVNGGNAATGANGGAGNWNTSLTNWDTSATNNTAAAWVANDDAIFAGTAGTVTLTAGVAARSLTFNTTGYIITGNTLTLAGTTPSITTAPGVTATISSVLAGSTAWSKTGTGTLILTNTGNTNAAATTISAGTLQLGAAGVIADATALTVASGAIFDLNNFAETIGSLSGAGDVTLGTATLTAGGANTSTTFSGIISETGNLVKTGTGTLTLSGNNTYTGKTSIQNGAISVASLNSVSGGTTSGGLGDPSSVANGTIALGATTTTGTLIYTGAGETTDRVINLAGTTGGGTIDQSGTGTLKFTSAFTATGAGDKTLRLQGSTAGTGEIAGAIVDNSASNTTSVTKSGTGTWVLSGNSTYTGTTTVSAGVLNLQNSGVLGTSAAGTSVASGAALQLQGGITVTGETLSLTGTGVSNDGALRNISGNNSFTGTITIQNSPATARINSDEVGSTLTLGAIGETGNALKTLSFGGAGNIVVGGAITANGGDLAIIKDGSGTLTLTGANTYDSGTTLKAGTVLIGISNATTVSGALGASSSVVTLGDTSGSAAASLLTNGAFTFSNAVTVAAGSSGTLTLGGNTATTSTFSGGITLNNSLTVSQITGGTTTLSGAISSGTAGTKTVTFANTGSITKSTGVIGNGSGSVAIVQSGTGTTSLSTANTFSGGTTIKAGTVVIGVSNATTVSGALGTSASAVTLGDITGSANASLLNGGFTFSNAITVASGSSGTLTLGGNAASSSIFSGAITLNNDLTIAQVASGTTNLTGNITAGTSGAKTLIFNNVGAVSQTTGVIGNGAGTVALRQSGAGTTTITGTNTFTGGVIINAGVLKMASAGALNAAGTNTLAFGASSTGKLQLNGNNFTVAGLNTNATAGTPVIESGSASAGTDTLTVNTATSDSYAGVLQNGSTRLLALTKSGTGALTLSGANTYTGVTTISGGVLSVATIGDGGVAGNLGAATNVAGNLVFNGGTLQYTGATASTNRLMTFGASGGTIESSGSGALTFANTGAAILSGTNTSPTITLAGTNLGNNEFKLSLGNNGTGKTAFIKDGVGKWILSATSGLSGATTVNAGTLILNGSISNSAITLNSGATLGLGTTGPVTLNAASLTWNGGVTGGMQFDLGATGVNDRLALTGALTKGTGSTFTFDFLGGGVNGGSYTLITAGSVSGFTTGNFTVTNLAAGLTGSVAVNGTNIVLTVIPEPQEYALGFAGAAALIAGLRRRRRAVK